MDNNSSNHYFTNVPQINLQLDDFFSFPSNSKDRNLSQIEMINDLNSTNNLLIEPIKLDGKPRSSSMVSDQIDRTDIDIFVRNRAGSMFVPNLCVHCKMLEETENQNIENSMNNLSDMCHMPLYSYTTSNSGSAISSRSSSNTDTSLRSSVENESNQFGLAKEFGQFLEVPKWKPRASSLDSGIFHNDLAINQSRRASFEEVLSQDKPRATSVDVHMQCDNVKSAIEEASPQESRKKSRDNNLFHQFYSTMHLSTRFSIVSISSRQTISRVLKKLKSSKFHLSPSKSNGKEINYCSQWNYDSHSREHIWYPDNSVRQRCSVSECTQYNATETYKCSACKTVSCHACKWKIKNTCRKTFCREPRDDDIVSEDNQHVQHHWVHKSHYKGTCKSCSKNMTSQNIFLNKQSVIALQCSWCKLSYHNKKVCFTIALLTEPCHFGIIKESIVYPCIIEKSSKQYVSDKDDENSDSEIEDYPFVYYSIKNSEDNFPSLSKSWKPILALINPKSGGRQGLEVLNELQWTLNPRQVFDICAFSPDHILRLFKAVTNLRILVGGGDGTVNWILRSVESCFGIDNYPPIAVIPIGTGNDLARELNWGSSYNSNDPISKVISDIENGTIVSIDIWRISAYSVSFEKLSTEALPPSSYTSKLPLESFNNYFSVGSDAATALEFHLDREKNPNRYNSRLKNKLCYVEIGSKDLWKREYKNLTDNISLVCDGISYKSRLAELRPHCILFLNITNYSAGTNPWGKFSPSSDFVDQSINDSILEVIGLSAASLATLHIGGQGDRICQCKSAEIVIQRDTPIQVDGEPMLIRPCTINISHKHQYQFIKRECRK